MPLPPPSQLIQLAIIAEERLHSPNDALLSLSFELADARAPELAGLSLSAAARRAAELSLARLSDSCAWRLAERGEGGLSLPANDFAQGSMGACFLIGALPERPFKSSKERSKALAELAQSLARSASQALDLAFFDAALARRGSWAEPGLDPMAPLSPQELDRLCLRGFVQRRERLALERAALAIEAPAPRLAFRL